METAAIDELLRRIAAFGLHEGVDITIELGDEDWTRLLQLVRVHRLSGLLSGAVRTGSAKLDGARRAKVDDLHRQMTARVLLLETMLVSVAGLLDAEAVPFRLLKGPAAAALYPDPIWRPYVDIDILVPGERFADSARILDHAGYRRRNDGLGEAFDRRFGKGATLRHQQTGVNVDLHRTLVAGPYGFLIEPADLFARTGEVEVVGASLPTMGREARFIHACISTVLSDARPKLITVRDVAQYLRTENLDPGQVDNLCERWRLRGVVATAVAVAKETLEVSDDRLRITEAERIPVPERLARWAYAGQDKRWRRQALTASVFVPGWANRMAYLRSVIGARGLDVT